MSGINYLGYSNILYMDNHVNKAKYYDLKHFDGYDEAALKQGF